MTVGGLIYKMMDGHTYLAFLIPQTLPLALLPTRTILVNPCPSPAITLRLLFTCFKLPSLSLCLLHKMGHALWLYVDDTQLPLLGQPLRVPPSPGFTSPGLLYWSSPLKNTGCLLDTKANNFFPSFQTPLFMLFVLVSPHHPQVPSSQIF